MKRPLSRRAAKRRSHVACATVCSTVALLLALAGAPQAFAAQKGVVSDITWGLTAAEQDRTAALMQEAGVKWHRIEADWGTLAADPSAWHALDRAVALMDRAGIKVLLNPDSSPPWASGCIVIQCPPLGSATFATFLTELGLRYGDRVDAYEIWNEEDTDLWWRTGPDPARYADLLKASHTALRVAAPHAEVVFGGLTGGNYQFLEAVYEAEPDIGDYFDVMAVHPYTFGPAPEAETRDANGRIARWSFPSYREIRATLEAHGDEKPLWFTEFGWSSATSWGVGEQGQADYLERALEFVEQDPYVEAVFWFSFRNNWWAEDADVAEDQFGLLRTDFSPKPAFAAFKAHQPQVPEAAPGETPPPQAPATAIPGGVVPTVGEVVEATIDDVSQAAVGNAAQGAGAPAPAPSAPAPEPSLSTAAEVAPSAQEAARPVVTARMLLARKRGTRTVSLRGHISSRKNTAVVRLQVRRGSGGGWRTWRKRTVRLTSRGIFTMKVQLPRGRRWRAQAVDPTAAAARRSSAFANFRS